jgi:tetratricopeptide (TPR) repeat protein
MRSITIVIILLLLVAGASAQKSSKVLSGAVFSGMDAKDQATIDKEMLDAVTDFQKVLSKNENDAMAQFGLSIAFGYDSYSKRDYFEAWKYFKLSEKNKATFSEDDIVVLNEYFFKQDKRRRGKTLDKNFEWEQKLVEEKLIKFVREENNIEYANKFLAVFPDSKYYENVVHIRNYIEFRIAENTASIEAYNTFLSKYPDAAQVSIAKDQRNQIAYNQVLQKNTLSDYRDFIKNYPGAYQVEDIKKRMGVLAFDEAAKARDIQIIDQFMAEYPNSSKMPDAKILKRQLMFERAKSINSMDAYNQFVALYPEGDMYVDIFNLKSNAMGETLSEQFPMDNYSFFKGFDNQGLSDYGGDLAVRSNGEIVVVTNTPRAKDEMYESWLLGLNSEGKMNWNKMLGNEFDDQVNRVIISSQNEIFVAGITNAIIDSIPGKAWIYKLDSKGKNEYNRILEGSEILDFGLYADGKALIGGYKINSADSLKKNFLTKVGKSGRKLWERSFSKGDRIYGVAVQPDNTGFIAAGNWIFAIDENGYILWDKTLAENQLATSVGFNNMGQILFSGVHNDKGFAISFDALANKVWETAFDRKQIKEIKRITPLADLSVICSGSSSDGKVILTKIDNTGKFAGSKEFSLSKGVALNGIVPLGGNFVGISLTVLGEKKDVLVFKLSF